MQTQLSSWLNLYVMLLTIAQRVMILESGMKLIGPSFLKEFEDIMIELCKQCLCGWSSNHFTCASTLFFCAFVPCSLIMTECRMMEFKMPTRTGASPSDQSLIHQASELQQLMTALTNTLK